ncbi:MAG: hypothetical protein LIO62_06045, partial [Clostridiales bacterium]|nr:hypothetical protein [Clostridiales bacterium]
MSQIINDFFENNVFTFRSYSCDCVEDIKHTTPGTPPQKTYKFQAFPDKPIFFAYRAKTGLSRIAANGTSEEDNILGSLIALPSQKPKYFYNFFQRNGFFFPVSSTKYVSIKSTSLYELIIRIRATVELMTAANEIHKDYGKIINLTFSLMLSKPLSIPLDSLTDPYTTCHHSFVDTLAKANGMELSDERKQEGFDKNTYTVIDTIKTPTYELPISEYSNIISGKSLDASFRATTLYRQITQLY